MDQIILSTITFDQLTQAINQAVRDELQSWASTFKTVDVSTPSSLEYLTRQATAAQLGISLVTLNDWTKTGKLKGYRIGTRVRYKAEDIENALQAIVTTKDR